MRRAFQWLPLLLFVLTPLFNGGCANPLAGDSSGFLPETGDFDGLVTVNARQTMFTDDTKKKYLGDERAKLFDQYGLDSVYTRDYTLNDSPLTIESYQISGNVGPVGIFYFYVGQQLRGSGEEIDIGGTQAVLDTARGGRNLYFYKGRWLFALIYTGKDPSPDLVPLAKFLAERIPGASRKPGGFEYLDVEGISGKYARITSGNALNFDIFPPGVYALAPDGGKDARVTVLDFSTKDAAEKTGSDFYRYLQVNALDTGTTTRTLGKSTLKFEHATEKREGKLVYAVFGQNIVIASRLDDITIGENLVARVIEKIYASNNANSARK